MLKTGKGALHAAERGGRPPRRQKRTTAGFEQIFLSSPPTFFLFLFSSSKKRIYYFSSRGILRFERSFFLLVARLKKKSFRSIGTERRILSPSLLHDRGKIAVQLQRWQRTSSNSQKLITNLFHGGGRGGSL